MIWRKKKLNSEFPFGPMHKKRKKKTRRLKLRLQHLIKDCILNSNETCCWGRWEGGQKSLLEGWPSSLGDMLKYLTAASLKSCSAKVILGVIWALKPVQFQKFDEKWHLHLDTMLPKHHATTCVAKRMKKVEFLWNESERAWHNFTTLLALIPECTRHPCSARGKGLKPSGVNNGHAETPRKKITRRVK